MEKQKWLKRNKHQFFPTLKEDPFSAVTVAQIALSELLSA